MIITHSKLGEDQAFTPFNNGSSSIKCARVHNKAAMILIVMFVLLLR